MGIMQLVKGAFSTVFTNEAGLTGNRTVTIPDASGTMILDTSTGTVLQVANYTTGAMATNSTIIPNDNTIPQITEGSQYMSLAFTPKKANSLLKIDVAFTGSVAGVSKAVIALFKDSGADAIAVGEIISFSSTAISSCYFTKFVTLASIATTTFTVRAGAPTAIALTFNGEGGVNTLSFGGVIASSITITEIAG